MANIKNLKIKIGSISFDPRNCFFKGLKVKEIYFNNQDLTHENSVLIWKNSDVFRFIKNEPAGTFEPNTLIFSNFSDNTFGGEYKIVDEESQMTEPKNMYVKEVKNNE